MDIKFICPYWGQEHTDLTTFIQQVKRDGYDGVEINVPSKEGFAEKLVQELQEQQLVFVAQQWMPPQKESVANYRERFSENLRRLAALKPVFINSHTGKDFFSFEENCSIIESADSIAADTGVPVIHETHRGRFNFQAAITANYLRKFPSLKMTADFSHWCCVSESMLEDQEDLLQKVYPHIQYIHARVGSEQSPQVNDPRAPEWEAYLNHFLSWWDTIVAYHRLYGTATLYICPEAGPVPYMPTSPYTQKVLSSQWDVNVWMMELLKARYKL